MSSLIEKLREIVGAAHILCDQQLSSIPTSHWNPAPLQALALVKPASSEEVSRVLALCNSHGQAVTIRGGSTGVVEGADPHPDELVLSLERMNKIIEIDATEMTATVEAGVILQHLQEQLSAQDLLMPLDLGARGSCMIGGNVATNAGGINVLRYGMMRQLVLGLEVVQVDGTVLSNMYPMLKNNTGYDLKQLFIGSEGTLGVITKALLRLFPKPKSCQTSLVALNSFDNVIALLNRFRAEMAGSLSAFEVMWHGYFADVTGEGKHKSPMARDYPFYAVIEAEGFDANSDGERFEQLLSGALEDGLIVDAVMASSARERTEIWRIREDFEALLPAYLYDVSLPVKHMEAYADLLQQKLRTRFPDSTCWLFGHIADGNLHIFIGPYVSAAHGEEIDRLVYENLAAFSGSVSAEHGIGIKKKPWLSANRSDDEIALMAAIKKVLDPNGLLNPGKLV